MSNPSCFGKSIFYNNVVVESIYIFCLERLLFSTQLLKCPHHTPVEIIGTSPSVEYKYMVKSCSILFLLGRMLFWNAASQAIYL
jgi:hypothetical protein